MNHLCEVDKHHYRTAADETIFGKLVFFPEWQMPLRKRFAYSMIGSLNYEKGKECSLLVREWHGVSAIESYDA